MRNIWLTSLFPIWRNEESKCLIYNKRVLERSRKKKDKKESQKDKIEFVPQEDIEEEMNMEDYDPEELA